MAARSETVFLVVNSAGEVRVAKRPRISRDEVSVRINIRFPEGWGTNLGAIDVDLPDPPEISTEGRAQFGAPVHTAEDQ